MLGGGDKAVWYTKCPWKTHTSHFLPPVSPPVSAVGGGPPGSVLAMSEARPVPTSNTVRIARDNRFCRELYIAYVFNTQYSRHKWYMNSLIFGRWKNVVGTRRQARAWLLSVAHLQEQLHTLGGQLLQQCKIPVYCQKMLE